MNIAAVGAQQPITASFCTANSIVFPKLEGVQLQTSSASIVTNYSRHVPRGYYFSHDERNVANLDFCNVSVAYSHTEHQHPINVQVWLPLDSWNGRMMGVGGGGWTAGLFDFSFGTMAAAVDEGYVTVSTDAGHAPAKSEPEHWALTGKGKVNMHDLEDFASVALGEAAVIGKSIIEGFFNSRPKFSYFNGCSTGGRQGLMLSQRYPQAYNGIMSACPATNWPSFIMAEFYPQFVMNELKQYPRPCELQALTAAAIDTCDGKDGVVDGVIANLTACDFDPSKMVGKIVKCDEKRKYVRISPAAATVAKETWAGAKSANGSSLWYGLNPDAELSGLFNLATTECMDNGTCTGVPFRIAETWIRYFVAKNPDFNLQDISAKEYEDLFAESVKTYTQTIGSNDPDLSKFQAAGGKIIMWHGLADQVIFPGGSEQYYQKVLEHMDRAQDFFRYFEAPGTAHCAGGPGPFPVTAFKSLVEWVERGTPPETLDGLSPPDSAGRAFSRPLCPYPQVARHNGAGDPHDASSFYCAESYLTTTPIRILLRNWKQGYMDFFRKISELQKASPYSQANMRKFRRFG